MLRYALLLAALSSAPLARAATITVDSGTDDGVGCTLREAVQAANTDTAVGGCAAGEADPDFPDQIAFSVSEVVLTQGEIVITQPVNINRSFGSTRVRIDAGGASRVLRVVIRIGPDDVRVPVVELWRLTLANGVADVGGALAIGQWAGVEAADVRFESNTATDAGGAVWVGPRAQFSTRVAAEFVGNRARGSGPTSGGGALFASGEGILNLSDTVFEDNRALGAGSRGGAVHVQAGNRVNIARTEFTRNRAPSHGGGLYVGPSRRDASTIIRLTTFDGNTVSDPEGRGGGAYLGAGSFAVALVVTAVRNRAGIGGAIWAGGGSRYRPDLTLNNSTLSDNTATTGGAVAVDQADAEFDTNTFSGNTASGDGGAISAVGGSVTLRLGNVFEGNRAGARGGATAADGASISDDGSTYVGNVADRGGALHVSAGRLKTYRTTLDGNRARAGGAVASEDGSRALVRQSVVRGNRADTGGGLYHYGASSDSLTVEQSLFERNVATGDGGGLFARGVRLDLDNSTLYANRAARGGGLATDRARLAIDSATLARNVASVSGGGLFNDDPERDRRLAALRNTIAADNQAPEAPDLAGRVRSLGHNLLGSTPPATTFVPEPSDQLSTDPRLGPLSDNGGPTPTAPLDPASPARDAGDTRLKRDQRAVRREDGADDIGAFEAAAAPTAALAAAPEPVTLGAVTPNPVSRRATTSFSVAESQAVTVSLYDVTGRRVRTLFTGPAEAASPVTVAVDGSSLAAGVYVIVLEGERVRSTRPVTVVR